MPYTTPTVNYCATADGTYTTLTGVQSVGISRGRQRFQDNFPQTSCSIDLIPAATYVLPLAVGQFIDVRVTNSSGASAYFVGNITDIERKYAIPYNSVSALAPADRIIITATGATGALGSQSFVNYALPSGSARTNIVNAAAAKSVNTSSIFNSQVTNSAQTFTGGALDLENTLLRTLQFMVDDVDNERVADLFTNYYSHTVSTFTAGQGNQTFTFSDAGTFGAYKYSDLQYISSVQNYFTQVQVVAPGLATQTASIGNAPYNTLVYNTYNDTATDAASLANFIVTTQSLATITPYSITTNTNIAATCTDISVLSKLSDLGIPGFEQMKLGATATIIFRGTSINATIQGINTTFYPDYAAVQLFLSPTLGTPFTLDSTINGILDTSRLGYP